jgi:hypothetical protein
MRAQWSILALCFVSTIAVAGKDNVIAPTRNNATNYKDRALTYCVAQAYKNSPAGEDAETTGAVFLDWTYYDLAANSEINVLIDKYLGRDYSNPFEGYEKAKFSMLKCIDMYHSKELEEQVKKYVPHPNWIGSKPPSSAKKLP